MKSVFNLLFLILCTLSKWSRRWGALWAAKWQEPHLKKFIICSSRNSFTLFCFLIKVVALDAEPVAATPVIIFWLITLAAELVDTASDVTFWVIVFDTEFEAVAPETTFAVTALGGEVMADASDGTFWTTGLEAELMGATPGAVPRETLWLSIFDDEFEFMPVDGILWVVELGEELEVIFAWLDKELDDSFSWKQNHFHRISIAIRQKDILQISWLIHSLVTSSQQPEWYDYIPWCFAMVPIRKQPRSWKQSNYRHFLTRQLKIEARKLIEQAETRRFNGTKANRTWRVAR